LKPAVGGQTNCSCCSRVSPVKSSEQLSISTQWMEGVGGGSRRTGDDSRSVTTVTSPSTMLWHWCLAESAQSGAAAVMCGTWVTLADAPCQVFLVFTRQGACIEGEEAIRGDLRHVILCCSWSIRQGHVQGASKGGQVNRWSSPPLAHESTSQPARAISPRHPSLRPQPLGI
jgi:hypothetical protein